MSEFKKYQREIHKHDWIVLPWHQAKTKKPGSLFKWKPGSVSNMVCTLISLEVRAEPNTGYVIYFLANGTRHKTILTPSSNRTILWLKSRAFKQASS